jgi:hypothetical protein
MNIHERENLKKNKSVRELNKGKGKVEVCGSSKFDVMVFREV